MTAATIRFNPAFEAFLHDDAVALFAGDRSLALRGPNNQKLIERLKEFFARPRRESEIEKLDPEIFKALPQFLEVGILLRVYAIDGISFYGESGVNDRLKRIIEDPNFLLQLPGELLVCIPDVKGLELQNEALATLKPGQSLLTAIYKGSSVFVLPLLTDPKTDLLELFSRLLATEPGVANLYLVEELAGKSATLTKASSLDESTALWVAADLSQLIAKGRLDTNTARIYRGSFVLREDVAVAQISTTVELDQTTDEKAEALSTMFLGNGKLIGRFSDYVIGEGPTAFFAVTADMARPRMKYMRKTESLDAWGAAGTRNEALVAGFMEALERYSIEAYELQNCLFSTRDALTAPALERFAVAGYGMFDTFSSDMDPLVPRYWRLVTRLRDHEQYAVALEHLHYPVAHEELGYRPPDQTTSSGVAAHLSKDLAINAACHELIERDAFLIAWLRRASPPLIEPESLPPAVKREIEAMAAKGWETRIMNLTSDLAPVICVLLSRAGKLQRYSIGASSRDDPEAACLKAIREARLSFHFSQKIPRGAAEVLEDINSPSDHMELYAGGEHDDLILKFFDTSNRCTFSSLPRFSGTLVDRIHNAGLDVYVADITNVDVRKLTPNIHVVRAIIPGLVPMQFGKNWARTGSPRIMSLPERMGWPMEMHSADKLQRFPHPFP